MRISDWSSDVCSSDRVAMHAAAQGLTGADRAFAVAIASEAMRWMVDIDALIDGATAQILPDDVKSRAVLRIALAQLLVLKSPGHAVVSTALPLVDGGPRRLVHARSEEHTSELQSLMRISYAVFCLKKKTNKN